MGLVEGEQKKEKEDPMVTLLRGAMQGDEMAILALKMLNNMALARNRVLRIEEEIQALNNIAKAQMLLK